MAGFARRNRVSAQTRRSPSNSILILKRGSTMKTKTKFLAVGVFLAIVINSLAQEVSIPDPGLNAAIRDELQKSAGPLTAQDLLSLTNLYASGRGVTSLEGLQAAHDLITLNL